MKYKKGSIVEVLVKDESCNHSWRCAQIISGKWHNYTVSYDVYPGFTNKADVERVSVKSIRPCPPLLEISECWVPNDVVEVFHNLSWKMAIVVKEFGLDQLVIRLVGSFQEFEVTKSELRVRQSYQNGEWIVIGKVPRDYKDANRTKLIKYDQDSGPRTNNHLMESHFVTSKTLKRASPCCYSQERARKFRASEKEGRRLRSPEKVCEKDMHNMKDNINGTYRSSRALTLELNDTSSVMSSGDSCSINSYKPYKRYYTEDHDSDAESVYQSGYHEETDQSQFTTNEAFSDEIHKLELHAYRCTMEALHASGPLDWEKESMGQSTGLILHQ